MKNINTKPLYRSELQINNKQFTIFVKINKDVDDDGYHYDLELRTKEKISGDEFQKLRRYLEAEGYIDQAIEYYDK
jgi:hypothetical protein